MKIDRTALLEEAGYGGDDKRLSMIQEGLNKSLGWDEAWLTAIAVQSIALSRLLRSCPRFSFCGDEEVMLLTGYELSALVFTNELESVFADVLGGGVREGVEQWVMELVPPETFTSDGVPDVRSYQPNYDFFEDAREGPYVALACLAGVLRVTPDGRVSSGPHFPVMCAELQSLEEWEVFD